MRLRLRLRLLERLRLERLRLRLDLLLLLEPPRLPTDEYPHVAFLPVPGQLEAVDTSRYRLLRPYGSVGLVLGVLVGVGTKQGHWLTPLPFPSSRSCRTPW